MVRHYGAGGETSAVLSNALHDGCYRTPIRRARTREARDWSHLKHLVQPANRESGTIQYSYDQSGNSATRTDPTHYKVTMSYDGMNRVANMVITRFATTQNRHLPGLVRLVS